MKDEVGNSLKPLLDLRHVSGLGTLVPDAFRTEHFVLGRNAKTTLSFAQPKYAYLSVGSVEAFDGFSWEYVLSLHQAVRVSFLYRLGLMFAVFHRLVLANMTTFPSGYLQAFAY
ncbi:hypothetical protein VXE32_004527 [Burkholderia cepacia]|nr:hypothetical protein [Burkholderia cepacia]